MTYDLYRLIHLSGIILLAISLGSIFRLAITDNIQKKSRRSLNILHGLGMLFTFGGGLGMTFSLEITWPWPAWLLVKMGIWFVLGGIIGLAYRVRTLSNLLWLVSYILMVVAAYFCIFKPFATRWQLEN